MIAAVLSALLATAARAASTEGLVTPTNLLLNYDHALLGPVEGLEAGAFAARVADASATWYNPAGLASVEQLSLNLTSSSFGLTSVRLDGFGASVEQSTFGVLPGFIGIVLAPPLFHSKKWRFGASITSQRSWRPSIDALFQDDRDGATQRFTYSAQVSVSTVRPVFAVGYALLPSLRLGLGLELAITSISANVTIANAQGTASAVEGQLLRSERLGATMWHLLGDIGIQWELVSGLVVGGVLKTPGARLYGQGLFSLQDLEATATGFSSVSAFDRSARYSLPLPLEADFGIAYSADWGALEADVRFHAGTSLQPLVTSSVPVTTVQANVVTQSPFPQILFAARPIANFALGGRLALSSTTLLHAGFFSDASPVAARSSPVIFPRIDVYGVTGGVSVKSAHLSAALGLAYLFGRSASFALAPDLGGPTAARLHIRALSALLSFSYRY